MENRLVLYDALLREGPQTEGVNLSLKDKLALARALDELGLHYIEGGWPGSNPKDVAFFAAARKMRFANSRLVAFGMTHRARLKPARDPNLRHLLDAGTRAITIFGKTWDFHIKSALGISREENLELIHDSVRYLKARVGELFFDAEHFFDGFRQDPGYAMDCLEAARSAGADVLVLCDTNGGALPGAVADATAQVRRRFPRCVLGIHCHNDADLGVANTLAAVAQGAAQIQGCMNGYGERCGNANLSSLIPTLAFKMKADFVRPLHLKRLTEVSHLVDEICNMQHRDNAPYVGRSAFAHKAGVHASAVQKDSGTYEHLAPDAVGNVRRILVSDQSGMSVLLHKAGERRIRLKRDDPEAHRIIRTLKDMESKGYQFEGAEASFEILLKKALGRHRKFFDLIGFRVIVENRGDGCLVSEATIKMRVNGVMENTVGEGDGPVNALDNALRKALTKFYPSLKEVHLRDFKVRVLDAKEGTAAQVRVFIESSDRNESWGTVGVSGNMIEASWEALVDSIDYKLLKDSEARRRRRGSKV